ncbi:MAG: DNA polymerase IV [Cyclobacteriaceae bacterium]|nr:DNA polymerase IV [Cyclobacteriaceae bacterium]MCH8514968.1 DNA polymerase IV [Cyclobacteriaceae bacterium]
MEDAFDLQAFRKIIHVDMDAFYASVEQLDKPELRNKPIAVGGSKERGVVAAASYEARQYGVKSAMPSKIAARKCPNLVFVKPRFYRYKEVSSQIRTIFFDYTDKVEPLSLDEAFLDVTTNKKENPSATILAKEIRAKIKSVTGLNASAGISYNKFLAKIASDLHKPNGQATIRPEQALEFLEQLPIQKFYGIGKVTAAKFKEMGVISGKELKALSLEHLSEHFGKSGLHFYKIVRGIHNSEVEPNRLRKSISAESTFREDVFEPHEVAMELDKVIEELKGRVERLQLSGRTITLKLKYSDFQVQTRSKSSEWPIPIANITNMAYQLLEQEPLRQPIRLLGLGISNLELDDEWYGRQLRIVFDQE